MACLQDQKLDDSLTDEEVRGHQIEQATDH